jgi:hypothetical protein
METTAIDVDAPGGDLLAAVAYLAVLAYPESYKKRDRCVAAMLALMNRGARHLGLPTAPTASELFKQVPPKRQAEILGRGSKGGALRRIFRRMQAARAASEMLSRSVAGRRAVSLNEVAAAYDGNASYFMHTIWAESKPVLHLALGLRSALMRLSWVDDGRPPYIQLLAKPEWVREAMRSAESWRRQLTAVRVNTNAPEFLGKLDPEAWIRLIPVDQSDSPTTPP